MKSFMLNLALLALFLAWYNYYKLPMYANEERFMVNLYQILNGFLVYVVCFQSIFINSIRRYPNNKIFCT